MKSIVAMYLAIPLMFTPHSYSQSLMLGIGVGGARIEGPQMYTNSFLLGGEGFVYEYSVCTKIMLSFPASSFSLVGIGSYHFMNASGTATPGLYENVGGYTEASTHFVNLSLGGQWSILEGPIAPYIGVNLTVTSFGKISVTGTYNNSAFRIAYGGGTGYGLGLCLGARIRLFNGVECEVNAAQNLYGFFNGIESFSSNLNTVGINSVILFSIN